MKVDNDIDGKAGVAIISTGRCCPRTSFIGRENLSRGSCVKATSARYGLQSLLEKVENVRTDDGFLGYALKRGPSEEAGLLCAGLSLGRWSTLHQIVGIERDFGNSFRLVVHLASYE